MGQCSSHACGTVAEKLAAIKGKGTKNAATRNQLRTRTTLDPLPLLISSYLMACYTPLEVPNTPQNDAGKIELTPEQETKHKNVLEHFSKDDFRVPDEEKGELMEEEKFWHVGCILFPIHVTEH